ncbi:MAG: HD domain-containing protein [Acidobacteria bacterium]|nr:HD domain-containing protein [Acidobacteriota bacterium]
MFEHEDRLARIEENLPLSERLEVVHGVLKERFPFVSRIAVAAYDEKRNLLKTFLASSGSDRPLVRYEAPLSEAPSLESILKTGRPRVVNDLSIFHAGPHEHTRAIGSQGYRASYTLPMTSGGSLWGFLFFNSYTTGVFSEEVLGSLDAFGHLIGGLVARELAAIRTLAAAVRTAHEMVHFRDPETGAHLDRMAEFSRLIARQLSADGIVPFTDEAVEQLFLFAPLHDLGKIGIPDRVLLKPGRLDSAELEEMQRHPERGVQMIDEILMNFGLGGIPGLDVLRNIALCHHEALDGTGYPRGIFGDEIPPEARIVAVADVFDALTSPRPYKGVWTNDEAFGELARLAGAKLDAECVRALRANREQVEAIQSRFVDARGKAQASQFATASAP